MYTDEELSRIIKESDNVEIPKIVRARSDKVYNSIRKRKKLIKKIRVAGSVPLVLILVAVFSIFLNLSPFNGSTVRSYTLQNNQLKEEKGIGFLYKIFNRDSTNQNLDLSVKSILLEENYVSIEYVVQGDTITDISNFDKLFPELGKGREITSVGAVIEEVKFESSERTDNNDICYRETIKLNEPTELKKGIVIKQNINKIGNIKGSWQINIKVITQKVKPYKVKESKVK